MGIRFTPTTPLDSSNLSSINDRRKDGPLDSGNIESINRTSGVCSMSDFEAAASGQAAGQPSPQPAPRPAPVPPPAPSPAPRPAPVPAPAPSAAPVQQVPFKAAPPLAKLTNKGQKSLLGAKGQISELKLGFGWNVNDQRCDVDISVFMLGEDEKVLGEEWFVFYGQPASPDRSISLNESPADDRKMITVDLNKMDSRVKKLTFVLTINEALTKNLNFSMIKDAYARVLDSTGSEMISFKISEYYANVTSMMMCEIYLNKDQWKFNAVGNGVARDLEGLCNFYGIEVK